MANSDLDVGDIVKLSPFCNFLDYKGSNPRDCTGEVQVNDGLDLDDSWVFVQWSNGKVNTYPPAGCDLILIESP